MSEHKIYKAVIECFSISKKTSYYLRNLIADKKVLNRESEHFNFQLIDIGLSEDQYNVIEPFLRDPNKKLFSRVLKSSNDKRSQHVKIYCVDADLIKNIKYNESDHPRSDEVVFH